MKMFTKISLILLTIASIAQANFLDSCITWYKNADFGPYKAPLAMTGGILGFGYLAYRDWQKSNEINSLKHQIHSLNTEALSDQEFNQAISKLPDVKNLEKRLTKIEQKRKTEKKKIQDFCEQNGFDPNTKLTDLTIMVTTTLLEHQRVLPEYATAINELHQQTQKQSKDLNILSNDFTRYRILQSEIYPAIQEGNKIFSSETQQNIFTKKWRSEASDPKAFGILVNNLIKHVDTLTIQQKTLQQQFSAFNLMNASESNKTT